MGLFDWLRKEKSNVQIDDDRIWLTKQAKLQGISADIAEALADSNGPFAILLVAHFSSLAQELQALVRQGGFDSQSVLVVMAEDLASYSTNLADFEESQWVKIVVAERHPLSSHDRALIAFAQSISCHFCIVHHISLDDPLMRLFAGEWVKQILQRLGMSEDQAIESRMVSRRILEAQKKIAECVTSDMPADSTEEWFERNRQ